MLAEQIDDIVHLGVEGIRPKHVPILLTYFLNAAKDRIYSIWILLLPQLVYQARKQLWPLVLDVPPRQSRNDLEKDVRQR